VGGVGWWYATIGVEYSVGVTITDPFSGQQDSRTQNFTIPERPVPFVSLGTAQRLIVASQPNTIAATASHRTCPKRHTRHTGGV